MVYKSWGDIAGPGGRNGIVVKISRPTYGCCGRIGVPLLHPDAVIVVNSSKGNISFIPSSYVIILLS